MQRSIPNKLRRALTWLAGLLILKVTLSVMLGYHNYFPPNFRSDFLMGRQSYFSGHYHWAFYTHIVSGPATLLLGLVLLSEPFRHRFPKWHRSLGKIQVMLVLLLLAPSGAWMACSTEAGVVASCGFFAMAVATGLCVLFGWRSAVNRQFATHRRWMWRCFLLLSSAVVLRIIGGFSTVTGIGATWSYPLASWASWLVPLAIFELGGAVGRRFKLSGAFGPETSARSAATLPLPAIEIGARR